MESNGLCTRFCTKTVADCASSRTLPNVSHAAFGVHQWSHSTAAALTSIAFDGAIDFAALERPSDDIALFNECARLHPNSEFRQ